MVINGRRNEMNGYTLTEVAREDVPARSFRYGQLASVEGIDAPADAWLIATDVSVARDETGAAGFDKALVVHFIYSDESEARESAQRLAEGGNVGPVTLVRPARTGAALVAALDEVAGEVAEQIRAKALELDVNPHVLVRRVAGYVTVRRVAS